MKVPFFLGPPSFTNKPHNVIIDPETRQETMGPAPFAWGEYTQLALSIKMFPNVFVGKGKDMVFRQCWGAQTH
jgi:hypothetical protein